MENILVEKCLKQNPEFSNYRNYLRHLFERGYSLQEAIAEINNEITLDEETKIIRQEMEKSAQAEAEIDRLVEECVDKNPDLFYYEYCLRRCFNFGGSFQEAIAEAYQERAIDEEMERMKKK